MTSFRLGFALGLLPSPAHPQFSDKPAQHGPLLVAMLETLPGVRATGARFPFPLSLLLSSPDGLACLLAYLLAYIRVHFLPVVLRIVCIYYIYNTYYSHLPPSIHPSGFSLPMAF